MQNGVHAEVKTILGFGDGAAPGMSPKRFSPRDPEHFGFHAQVFIGVSTGEVSDGFDIVVCTPSWFASQVAEGNWDRVKGGGLAAPPRVGRRGRRPLVHAPVGSRRLRGGSTPVVRFRQPWTGLGLRGQSDWQDHPLGIFLPI
jgi:Immunity protein 8